jgi:predicted ATPase
MKIEIQNLGVIKQAVIDLSKNLTVFCGPNNSGKTYLSYIIYALTKSGFKYLSIVKDEGFISELLSKQKAIFKINIDAIWNYRNDEINGIKENLDSIFGVSDDVIKNLFSNFSIQILQSKDEFAEFVKELKFENELKLNNVSIFINKNKNSLEIELILQKKSIQKESIEIINLFLETKLYSLITFYPFINSFILPVERNSIYTFSKELSMQKQDLIDRAQTLGSKSNSRDPFDWLIKSSRRYSLPIRDGLEIAEDLTNYSKIKSDFFDFAEEIENEILQGKIIISKDGDVQFSPNKAKSKKLPIHLSASIVKTLSSLVFYLKHIANKNELIIIDEPELNLHPNNQILLSKIFGKLINKGFRLLISTHSDYIIREINNLIMASNQNIETNEIATKYGYNSDIWIDKNSVSVYLFHFKNETSKNVTISPVNVTETGFDVETIDKTINKLNEISEELFYSIKYGLEGNG